MSDLSVILKYCFIGPRNVGKTSIIKRLSKNEFNDKYEHTQSIDYYYYQSIYSNRKIYFQIWDQTGDGLGIIRPSYYYGCDGLIAVYDITMRESLVELISQIREVISSVMPGTPMILVGNKCDCEDKREISTEKGESYAKRNGFLFVETSAKNSINVTDIFDIITDDIFNRVDNIR